MQEDGPTEKEYEKKRILRDPGQLTKVEIDEHNVDHALCRSCCSSCARAMAEGTPRKARPDERDVQLFGVDYVGASELQLGGQDWRFTVGAKLF